MNLIRALAGLFAFIMLSCQVQAMTTESYFPSKDLGRLLSEKLDLATIQCSLGPRRTPAKRTFANLGMKPTQVTDDAVVFSIPGDWVYELRVVARGDFNNDGIEDLKVCFVDHALNGGNYDAAQGLLLTRYSDDGYVVALSYSLKDGLCPSYAR
jgi:hypothetical protein